MRHSFASNLLIAGVSDVLVARWLGHADTSMLHQRYGHLLAYHSDIDTLRLTWCLVLPKPARFEEYIKNARHLLRIASRSVVSDGS